MPISGNRSPFRPKNVKQILLDANDSTRDPAASASCLLTLCTDSFSQVVVSVVHHEGAPDDVVDAIQRNYAVRDVHIGDTIRTCFYVT